MLSASFLQLHTAMYEWSKECPPDTKNALASFFLSTEFLDRPNVFYYGMEKRLFANYQENNARLTSIEWYK